MAASKPPRYFDEIKAKVRNRWEILDRDPGLAGPWWQLFKSVQSPQHVLSELLQNADDAGATWARAWIEGNDFVFEHDGHDFTKAEFEALCSFGQSSKASFFTIGFRGVGFKSTFSLGKHVYLFTPSLSVYFDQRRFTEPEWVDAANQVAHTRIQVSMTDAGVAELMGRQLDEWYESPISVLFFRNLRRLTLGEAEITAVERGEGPVPSSAWMRLTAHRETDYLLVHSAAETIPDVALQEIRDERGAPDLELPPVEVTLVIDSRGEASGALYAVLPVGTSFPGCVSVQAPFMQNPGRTAAVDPALSHLNKWLLNRATALLVDTVTRWVSNTELTAEERAKCYMMLPPEPQSRFSGSVDGSVERLVCEQVGAALRQAPSILLTGSHAVAPPPVAAVPRAMLNVWSENQILDAGFDAPALLAPEVSDEAVEVLSRWNLVTTRDHWQLLWDLRKLRLPVPDQPLAIALFWESFAELWQEEYSWDSGWWKTTPLIPSGDRLVRASELALPAESHDKIPEDEWQFVVSVIRTPDPRVSELLRALDSRPERAIHILEGALGESWSEQRVRALGESIKKTGLTRDSSLKDIVTLAVRAVQTGEEHTEEDKVKVGIIAARARVSVSDAKFLCRDGRFRDRNFLLLAEAPDQVKSLLPRDWLTQHVVIRRYSEALGTRDWRDWALDPQGGGMRRFARPQRISRSISDIRAFCKERGVAVPELKYKTQRFEIEDYEWPADLKRGWEERGCDEDDLWARILEALLKDWDERDDALLYASAKQISQQGTRATLEFGDCVKPVAKWIVELRGRKCLPDDTGNLRYPHELLLKTPDTDALSGVEPFVLARLSTEKTRQVLVSLGVRNDPASAQPLLSRLQALAETQDPPIIEVSRIYHALERLTAMNSALLAEVATPFATQRLVLTSIGWQTGGESFIRNPASIPGMPIVRREFGDLEAFWRRVGLREAPSRQDAFDWLAGLPADRTLEDQVLDSVKALLNQYGQTVWREVGRWLDSSGRLAESETLRYVTQSPSVAQDLFEEMRRCIADGSVVPDYAGFCHATELADLEGALHTKLAHTPQVTGMVPQGDQESLRHLGRSLQRIVLGSPDEPEERWAHDRHLARALERTAWKRVEALTTVSYLDGKPAGPPRQSRAFWEVEDATFYTVFQGFEHYEEAARAIAAGFKSKVARNLVEFCWMRAPRDIDRYIEANLERLRPDDTLGKDRQVEPVPVSEEETTVKPPETGQPEESVAEQEIGYCDWTDGEEAADDGIGGDEAGVDTAPEKKVKSNPAWQITLERAGFKPTVAGEYEDAGGRLIRKAQRSALFSYELVSGDTRDALIVADKPIKEGLVVAADLWQYGQDHPDRTWVLDPIEGLVSFAELMRRKRDGQLELYADRYRLCAPS